jgi:hypothetical protein
MDLQVTSRTLTTRDMTWLATRAGLQNALPGTLLIAGANKAKHYPDGYIRPGTLLARYTSGANQGLLAPFVNDGSTGLNAAVGIALDGFRVRYDDEGALIGTRTAGSVLYAGSGAMVYLAKLPNLLLANGTTNYVVTSANLPAGIFAVTL